MEEGTMNTQTPADSPVNIIALGWGLAAALVALFVVCLVVALALPDWRASHGWIGLFSVAPMTSVRVWIDGIIFSIVFGWIGAVVLGLVCVLSYEAVAALRRLGFKARRLEDGLPEWRAAGLPVVTGA
jgi:hypothetical protein